MVGSVFFNSWSEENLGRQTEWLVIELVVEETKQAKLSFHKIPS